MMLRHLPLKMMDDCVIKPSMMLIAALWILTIQAIVGISKPVVPPHNDAIHAYKYVGASRLGTWRQQLTDDKNPYYHYDVDLYSRETAQIRCPPNGDIDVYLDPIREGMFYNTGAVPPQATSFHGMYTPSYRLKSKIGDFMNTLEIKNIGAIGWWTISFVGVPRHRRIERMYFDCISMDVDETLHLATVQINVMPQYGFISGTETVVMDKYQWMPPHKVLLYYKYPRQGTKLIVDCTTMDKEDPEFSRHTVTQENEKEGPDHRAKVYSYAFDFTNINKFPLKSGGVPHAYCKYLTGNSFYLVQQLENDVITLDWLSKNPKTMTGSYTNEDIASHPFIRIYNDYANTIITPSDCPRHVELANGRVVALNSLMANLNIARYTKNIWTLDRSNYYSHRKHSTYCTYPAGDEKDLKSMRFEFSPACDYNNPHALDSDGITCSVFVSNGSDIIVRGYKFTTLKPIFHETIDTKTVLRKPQNNETICEGCFFNKIQASDVAPISVEEGKMKSTGGTSLVVRFSSINYNPRYYTWSDSSEEGEDGTIPAPQPRIMAIYMSDTIITPQLDGSMKVSGYKIQSAVPGGSKYFSIPLQGTWKLKLKCSDFFNDSSSHDKLKLYPEGKNTFFSTVDNGKVDPKQLEHKEFQREFASHGISIYKKPETLDDYDLEIVYDADRGVWSERKKPAYFICAREDWTSESGSYAIIAVDPGYNVDHLHGCGTRPELFLNNENTLNSEKVCDYTLDDERTIGFFCPTPIPDHFLEGDQQQWAYQPGGSGGTTNPYKQMVQCYDRSTKFQRFLKLKSDLKLFAPPKEVGEVRSLWIFTKSHFIRKGMKPISRVICHCFGTDGKVAATIHVSSGFKK